MAKTIKQAMLLAVILYGSIFISLYLGFYISKTEELKNVLPGIETKN
jgi:hypothetical protein